MELETVPSASQNADLHEAIGGMRYLLRATTIMPESARVSVEEMVRELSRETIELAEKVRDALYTFFRLEDELQTDGRLDSSLVIAGLLANALDHLIGTATEHSIPDWLTADMERLRKIAEEYRDIEETLAIGRSQSFQRELQEVKREATK